MLNQEICNFEIIPDDVKLYTVSEVAKILKTNRNYVYELIKSGRLPCIQLGHIKIRHDALATFLRNGEGFNYTDPYNIVKAS